MSSNPRVMDPNINVRLCLECFKSGWLGNTGCWILLFLTSDLPESYLICVGFAQVKGKRDDTLSDSPLTLVNVVFLLCLVFPFQYPPPCWAIISVSRSDAVGFHNHFSARLLSWAVRYLAAAGLFEDVTGVEDPAQRQSVKAGKKTLWLCRSE